MASASLELLKAIRSTYKKLETGATYHWGHMGACNCGNLAQELLKVSKAEIHAWALESREGDWSEQTDAYCPTSNLPVDVMISKLLLKGLTSNDLKHLEKLSDPIILSILPEGRRELNYHFKADVIEYLKAWSLIIENELVEKVNLQDLAIKERVESF